MAFVLPTFNLVCNIFTGLQDNIEFRLESPCNLAMGRRNDWPFGAQAQSGGSQGMVPHLLLPALTDIRDGSCGPKADLVEVPKDSGRFYNVIGVDDLGKGFPNEHRMATLAKVWGFNGNGFGLHGFWPTPIP